MIKTIITDILKGIVYLQYANIVHNDIKRNNVVISFPYPDRTRPKATIIDFDLARQITYKNGKVDPVCHLQGNPNYFPLEVYAKTPADPNKRDVWAAGITLYFMLKRKYLLDNINVLLAENIEEILTSGIPKQAFVFTDAQNKYPEMSLVIEALKAMLTPDATRRPFARECLEILEGAGSSSKVQITSNNILQDGNI
jgi:serine/threonine protein kinase